MGSRAQLVRYLYDEVKFFTSSEHAWHCGALTHTAKESLDKRLQRICSCFAYASRYADNAGYASISDKYIWLTVRPPDNGCQLGELVSLVRKFASKIYIKRYCYCFEQKGVSTDTLGNGFHFHLWAEFTNSYSAIQRTVKDMFPWIGTRLFQSPEYMTADKIWYMMGNKDKEKMKAVFFDKLWRHKVGLAELYITDFELPTCKPTTSDMDVHEDQETREFEFNDERHDAEAGQRPEPYGVPTRRSPDCAVGYI